MTLSIIKFNTKEKNMANTILSLLQKKVKQDHSLKDGNYNMIPTPFVLLNEKMQCILSKKCSNWGAYHRPSDNAQPCK